MRLSEDARRASFVVCVVIAITPRLTSVHVVNERIEETYQAKYHMY